MPCFGCLLLSFLAIKSIVACSDIGVAQVCVTSINATGMAVFMDNPPLAQDVNIVGGVLSHRCLDEADVKRSKSDGQDVPQIGTSHSDGLPTSAAPLQHQYISETTRSTVFNGAAGQTPSDKEVMHSHSPRIGIEKYDPCLLACLPAPIGVCAELGKRRKI